MNTQIWLENPADDVTALVDALRTLLDDYDQMGASTRAKAADAVRASLKRIVADQP